MERNILLVEDEVDSILDVKYELEERGFNVIEANTLTDAQKQLSNYSFDVALVDLMIPKEVLYEVKIDAPSAQNGFELIECIRNGQYENKTKRTIPIFVISSLGSEAQSIYDECRDRFSPKDLFAKPLTSVYIAEKIRIALERPNE